MKRKWIFILFLTLIAILLAGCGTTKNDTQEDVNGSDNDNGNEIVAGSIVPNISEGMPENKYHYVFSLKNNTTDVVTLNMNSSQYYDFHLKDNKGTVVYTYSDDKMFTQALEQKIIKPGDSLLMDLDLTEGLSTLEPGTYTVEAWSTANEAEDWMASTEVTWDGAKNEDSSAEEKLVVEEARVTYVGLQDLNSIEVTNEQNETVAMRLSETAKPFFDDLETGAKITVFYVVIDGQKVIQTATKD
ncbi:BsuPI-related putative proteinase inhibitor [Paenisporosarcina antarctica]|uniref:Intracellular proteinase inhibitor BsuPI domain-containing protein n=1 Tax=Paenisporosarcina antarctica TaxID=417367 RepID=A0A4P7A0U9_9BACL|nr:BsuPI-related putative proteinase inhibitor [Paenisporosarcina antarctica]QBP42432.1 hypothetical protein E2636_15300 [Paenisporosarcina antarctica]